MTRAGLVVLLVAAWCLMWGSISPADLLGGLIAAAVVQVFIPTAALPGARLLRPVATVRFGARFITDLVVASVTVAAQAFWPRDRLRPRVVTVNLPTRDPAVLTVVGNAITLTPGTLTLEVDQPTGTLLIHALHTEDGHDVVAAAEHYERLVSDMLGPPREVPS